MHADARKLAGWIVSQYGASALALFVLLATAPTRVAFVWAPLIGLAAILILPFLRIPTQNKYLAALGISVLLVVGQIVLLKTLPGRIYYYECSELATDCVVIDEFRIGSEQFSMVRVPTPAHAWCRPARTRRSGRR